jgi:hypothetical protein
MDEFNLEITPQCQEALTGLVKMVNEPLNPSETQEERNQKAEGALKIFQRRFGEYSAFINQNVTLEALIFRCDMLLLLIWPLFRAHLHHAILTWWAAAEQQVRHLYLCCQRDR